MKTRNSTKSKLLSSVIALVLCVSMLIGATFAWFTDTASTAVNKIQAGNLDVKLLDAAGNSLEGQSLEWQKAAAGVGEEVLWEPGCSYTLTPFKIKNNGNLALKYIVTITGIVGNAELLNVIDFTVEGVAGAETAAALNNFEGSLAPNSETGMITIKGTMKTTADNTYQGKSIDGIGITVRAAQLGGEFAGLNGEHDSFDNTYDESAMYPPLATYLNETTTVAKPESGDMVIETSVAKSTVPAAAQIKSAAKTDDSATTIANHTMAAGSKLDRVLKTTESTADSVTYDISYVYTETTGSTSTSYDVSEFSSIVTNVIELSTGLKDVKVTHSHNGTATPMEKAETETAAHDGHYYYNPITGKLTIWSSKYSSFEISFKNDFAAATGGQGYATLKEAINAAENVALVTVLKDFEEDGIEIPAGKTITLDLAGKTITGVTDVKDTAVITNNGTLTINGEQGGIAAKAIAVLNNGSLTVNGGTYSNHGQTSSNGSYIFDTQAGGTATIDGVTISALFKGIRAEGVGAVVVVKNSTADVAPGYGLFAAAAGGQLTVESGTYKTTYSEARQMFDLKNQGKITVSGGSFTTARNGSGDGAEMVVFNQSGNANSTFEVTGGTFNCVRDLIYYNNPSHDDIVWIQGGTFVYRNLINNPNGSDNISISGGVFNKEPNAQFIANGKFAVVGEDGKWTVGNPPATWAFVTNEAEFNTALQDTSKENIVLKNDIVFTATKNISRTITVDIGANKLTTADTDGSYSKSVFQVEYNGNLTLLGKTGSLVKSGNVTNVSFQSGNATIKVYSPGKLTIDGVNVEGHNMTSKEVTSYSAAGQAICVTQKNGDNNRGSLTILNAAVKSGEIPENEQKSGFGNALELGGKVDAVIKNCQFSAGYTHQNSYPYTIRLSGSSADVYMEDCTVTAPDLYFPQYGDDHRATGALYNAGSKVTLVDCQLSGKNNKSYTAGAISVNGTCDMYFENTTVSADGNTANTYDISLTYSSAYPTFHVAGTDNISNLRIYNKNHVTFATWEK